MRSRELLEQELCFGCLLVMDMPKSKGNGNKALTGVAWSHSEKREDDCRDLGANR